MTRRFSLAAACLALTIPLGAQTSPEAVLRRALLAKTGMVTLPGGEIEISREIVVPPDAHDLNIGGAGTTIKAAAGFRGRALIVLPGGKNIKLHNLNLDGNRDAFPEPVSASPISSVLSGLVANNGLLAQGVTGLEITAVKATHIAGFPILVSGGSGVHIRDIEITASGSLDTNGHNNGTGGILLEEGVMDFEIIHPLIGEVRGNGIWIRSAASGGTIATASRGHISGGEFAVIARSAIELNHATGVTVENNTGHMIGFPGEAVLISGTFVPAAISTTGAVDHAVFRNNNFEQLAGRCGSFDGLSESEVNNSVCSASLFNALYIRGTGNRITGNHFTDLNNSRRDSPEALITGIYLANGAARNTVEGNEISGYGIEAHCIAGPGLAGNTIAKNLCSGGSSLALLQPSASYAWRPLWTPR